MATLSLTLHTILTKMKSKNATTQVVVFVDLPQLGKQPNRVLKRLNQRKLKTREHINNLNIRKVILHNRNGHLY